MIFLDPNKKTPMYEQLFRELRKEILNHNLEEDEKLKSIRQFAHEIGVSFNTVNRTYQMLLAEGYIRAVPGSGFYVEPLHLHQDHRTQTEISFPKKPAAEKILYDFRYDVFERDTFPWNKWRKYINNAITEQYYQKNVSYIENKGGRALRESLASYMLHSRGITCDPDQIVVGAGASYLLDLIMKLMPERKAVGVESPGYPGVFKAGHFLGRDIVPISLDDQGISVKELYTHPEVRLCFTTPSHQFPTGVTMSIGRRSELLLWARQADAYIIEDDYDSEFRLTGRPIPSLQSIDEHGRVIYMNTFSKSIASTIRISYMVLPPALANAYYSRLSFYSCTVSTFEQYTLARFISDGYFEKHLNRMRLYYARLRKQLLRQIGDSPLAGRIEVQEQDSGLHFLLKLDTRRSDPEFRELLASHGVNLLPISAYYQDPDSAPEHTFIFNYSSLDSPVLEQALPVLAECI